MSASLILIGAILCIASGLPALLAGRDGLRGATILIIAGATAGLAGSAIGLTGPRAWVAVPWGVPNGVIVLSVDSLSAFFAAPVFLLAGAGGLYAHRYWPPERGHATSLRCFFGLMTGALAFVMTAGHTMFFLAAWEIMAVAAFFLVATEHEQADVRRAGWLYLALSHVATVTLFGLFTLLHSVTHTWTFAALPHGIAMQPVGKAIFVMAVFAFGVKAGLMPFHVWLPGAHAAAPSHVSAVMSGVVIKVGIYGLFRVMSLFDITPPAFGATLLLLGIVSSILGVAFALVQHDLKRLLAYHSIENIGIIVIGLGVGLLARAHGFPRLALLGYAGGLLHVWNHALFKSLLFLSAGSAIHETHTREIDRQGGLARVMPWTASAFVLGAVAICGLPPLNGFVSEWLLYLAGFRSLPQTGGGWTWLLLVLVAPALALTGALALACFVKAFGIVFLGTARSTEARHAREAPLSMRAATVPLGVACIAIGVAPVTIAPMLARVVAVAASTPGRVTGLDILLRPVQQSAIAVAVIGVVTVIALILATRRRTRGVTWDCGYARPMPRMQYTASSFAQPFTGLFSWVMRPVVHRSQRLGLFPSAAAFESHVPDTVLDRALLPALRGLQWVLAFARFVQSGRVQLYLLYLAATLVVLLAWSAQ
jgi:hydrogenase-4 component B